MKRRAFVAGMAAVMAAPKSTIAQQSEKVHRIGFGAYQPCNVVLDRNGTFLQELRQFGYIEGRNLIIECRDASGNSIGSATLPRSSSVSTWSSW